MSNLREFITKPSPSLRPVTGQKSFPRDNHNDNHNDNHKLSIAVVATYDVTDISHWSGMACYIYRMLEKHYDVTPVTIHFKRPLMSWIRGYYYNRIAGKRYFVTFDKSVHAKSRPVYKKNLNQGFDIILTFDYFLIPEIARYAKHTILYTDATFDNLLNYYDYRTGLCPSNIRDGHQLQKESFKVLKYTVLSSDWAKNSALRRYGASKDQLVDIKYGSNLSRSLPEDDLESTLDKRQDDKLTRLFFPNVYWERKGGEYVLEILKKLNALNFPTRLIVAGKFPESTHQNNIDYVGYLNKKNPRHEDQMIEQYKRSHFLIMPSKADCTPVVFPEANSFALPVISTKTGGIESVVNSEYDNGICFKLDENYVDKVVAYIIDITKRKDRYRELCTNAYHTYRDYFDWQNGEKVLVKMIDSLVKNPIDSPKTLVGVH